MEVIGAQMSTVTLQCGNFSFLPHYTRGGGEGGLGKERKVSLFFLPHYSY